MLQLVVPVAPEGWDEKLEEFVPAKTVTLKLEHSLVSISKWESKWRKAFLAPTPKTDEEIFDYIKCMSVSSNVDPEVFDYLTQENIKEIQAYIDSPMTATTFSDDKSSKGNREIVTSELIYYWMFANSIPKDLEKWHINRLMTLIRIFSVKNNPPQKRSKRDIMSRNAALNAARRKQYNSKG
jgi:hypothetical protein